MTITDATQAEMKWLTCGNEQAGDFIFQWRAYIHGIDDIIDGEVKGSEAMLSVFMRAAFVYTHPFFVANMAALRQIAVNCTNAYADTVAWEKAPDWRGSFSDHYRHFGIEMILAVAGICGGYHHMRKISPVLRELGWREHHDEKGNPV